MSSSRPLKPTPQRPFCLLHTRFSPGRDGLVPSRQRTATCMAIYRLPNLTNLVHGIITVFLQRAVAAEAPLTYMREIFPWCDESGRRRSIGQEPGPCENGRDASRFWACVYKVYGKVTSVSLPNPPPTFNGSHRCSRGLLIVYRPALARQTIRFIQPYVHKPKPSLCIAIAITLSPPPSHLPNLAASHGHHSTSRRQLTSLLLQKYHDQTRRTYDST